MNLFRAKCSHRAVEQIVGRERRQRVSQLAWCGEGALIRAAASTQPFDIYSHGNANTNPTRQRVQPLRASSTDRVAGLVHLDVKISTHFAFVYYRLVRHWRALQRCCNCWFPKSIFMVLELGVDGYSGGWLASCSRPSQSRAIWLVWFVAGNRNSVCLLLCSELDSWAKTKCRITHGRCRTNRWTRAESAGLLSTTCP